MAGTKGIGFFDSYAINELSHDPILPNISFKQVVCSENRKDSESSIIAIFAISEHDELYFIHGRRTHNDSRVYFQASGFPIRRGVVVMSPQYNMQTNSCEILYVTNEVNSGLHHLIRDPITSLWTDGVVEFKLHLGTPAILTKEPVYLTNIALSDSEGNAVPNEYPVSITASPAVHVTCNGRSLLLNHNPCTVLTGANGQIDLNLPADASMSCSQLKLQLTKFPPENGIVPTGYIEINPAQRVVNIMSALNNKETMKQARGPDKEPVFDADLIDEAAPVITRFGIMAEHVVSDRLKDEDEKKAEAFQKEKEELERKERERKKQDEEARRAREEYDQALRQKNVELMHRASLLMKRDHAGNWFEYAVENVEDAIKEVVDTVGNVIEEVTNAAGDAIECIKEGLTQMTEIFVNFVMELAGPVCVMLFQAAGKVFSIKIPGVGPLLGTVFGVLKDILKAALPKLYNFLRLLFDGETTRRVQKVFHRFVTSTMDSTEKFCKSSAHHMSGLLEDFHTSVKNFIPDERAQSSDPAVDRFISKAKGVMNNPIVKTLLDLNPMTWLAEGVTRGVSRSLDFDEIEIPSVGPEFDLAAAVFNGADSRIVEGLLGTVFSTVSSLASNGELPNPEQMKQSLLNCFGGLLHSLIETGKDILIKFLEALSGMIISMKDYLMGEWKIPGLTNLWEDLTGLKFTILNFVTYILAVVWKAIMLAPSLILADSDAYVADIDRVLEKMEGIDIPSLTPVSELKRVQQTVMLTESTDPEMRTMHKFHSEKETSKKDVGLKTNL